MDGSEATRNYLSTLYPESVQQTAELPDGALDYIHSYEQAAQDLKYLEEKKEEAANRLDEPKLRQEHEKLYKRYLKPRSYRRFSIQ